MKIAIGLPTNRGVRPKTVQSLLEMVDSTESEFKFIVSEKGYNTAENRNYIAAQSLKNLCTHLLLTDDDMVYEKDVLTRLLKHDKDVIGGTYNTKYESQEKVIEFLDEIPEGRREHEMEGKSPFKCKALGGGMLLIKTEIFRKIPQPWFGYKWFDNGMVQMSNDWFFCEKAIEAGYDIWCDPTLEIKHLAEREV